MNKKKYNVAVVGATGAVGNQIIICLEERNFPIKKLSLLASKKSVGKKINFKDSFIEVKELKKDSFKNIDIAIFSAGGIPSKKFAPFAAKEKCLVIDNSSAWRMNKDVPLIIPEVNAYAIKNYKKKYIIANPNCSTIQMLVALGPIHKKYKIKRIVVSTYQAVSGTGKKAIEELFEQTRSLINHTEIKQKVYPHRIAFNCLPHIDSFLDNGYTKEEEKMINETKKILEDDSIGVSPTTVRVPVFYSHSESINIETEKKINAKKIRNLLEKSEGIKIVDNPSKNEYPLAINAADTDFTFVGRIRDDLTIKNGVNMWVVADNIRKGAATNAIQIAEKFIENFK